VDWTWYIFYRLYYIWYNWCVRLWVLMDNFSVTCSEKKNPLIKQNRILHDHFVAPHRRSGLCLNVKQRECRARETQTGWLILIIINECENILKDHWHLTVFYLCRRKPSNSTCTEQDRRSVLYVLSDDFGGDQPYETTPSSQFAQCPMNIHVHEIRH